jgi:hypothetical protein
MELIYSLDELLTTEANPSQVPLSTFGMYVHVLIYISLHYVSLTSHKACTKGNYYFDRYELRGKVITDSNGYFEVLSVTPGAYLGRAGHFHYIITPSDNDRMKYENLTTQSYICKANSKDEMNTDL